MSNLPPGVRDDDWETKLDCPACQIEDFESFLYEEGIKGDWLDYLEDYGLNLNLKDIQKEFRSLNCRCPE